MRRLALAAVVLAAAAPPAASASAPRVEQLVVQRDGEARQQTVRARAARVRLRGRRCAVPAGTPLAALVRGGVPRIGLRDFGSCGRRARDAAGLFVTAIGRDRNRGTDGWVYKVGTRQGSAGAADPAGPFGRGRLRDGSRVTWFYCRFDRGTRSCQRTLALRARPEPGGVAVRVLAHDDAGRAVPAVGATVHAGGTRASTDARGFARIPLPPGRHFLHAELDGAIRSFREVVAVP